MTYKTINRLIYSTSRKPARIGGFPKIPKGQPKALRVAQQRLFWAFEATLKVPQIPLQPKSFAPLVKLKALSTLSLPHSTDRGTYT